MLAVGPQLLPDEPAWREAVEAGAVVYQRGSGDWLETWRGRRGGGQQGGDEKSRGEHGPPPVRHGNPGRLRSRASRRDWKGRRLGDGRGWSGQVTTPGTGAGGGQGQQGHGQQHGGFAGGRPTWSGQGRGRR